MDKKYLSKLAAKSVHHNSGISDENFQKYDIYQLRNRQATSLASGLGMSALATGLAAKHLNQSQLPMNIPSLNLTLTPQHAKNLGRASKALRLGAIGSLAGAAVARIKARGLDPVYEDKSAPYRLAGGIINPKTTLERYYADYNRPISREALQVNKL